MKLGRLLKENGIASRAALSEAVKDGRLVVRQNR